MFQNILVPLDGSPRAEQALPVAARIARASGGDLVLLKVATQLLDLDVHAMSLVTRAKLAQEESINKANDYLAQVAASSDLQGIDFKIETLSGSAAQMILMYAQMQGVDLIVMCSHGVMSANPWKLGSVAQKVARHSPVPVLILHERGRILAERRESSQRPLRILVPLDGSPLAETALIPAARLCAALATPAHGALHLVRVLRLPTLKEGGSEQRNVIAEVEKQALRNAQGDLRDATRRLRKKEIVPSDLLITSSVVIQTDVADTLIRIAEAGKYAEGIAGFNGCDIIAMATHGRSGLGRWVMGSTTERVLGAAILPLLIVRPPQPQTTV